MLKFVPLSLFFFSQIAFAQAICDWEVRFKLPDCGGRDILSMQCTQPTGPLCQLNKSYAVGCAVGQVCLIPLGSEINGPLLENSIDNWELQYWSE